MTRERGEPVLDDDPLWYKDAIIYEIHVRAFHDSDGDGVGDFRGLTRKLDYLQELGVTALWILPFYPSPLRDDGYDIADYRSVNPRYGDLDDFRVFLREAHARGLRVITELVINHTSDQHPWFQRARRAPKGSPEREYYVWSDDPERYSETRIIFQDYEPSNWTWDSVAEQYYWHRFFHHQPDLNFDNPRVRREVVDVLDYWLEMGVDGMRLDAVPYLFEREGTNCENLPETHDFLRDLRRHVDENFENRMLLAEANQWPEDAVAYFGDGDECHMNFHFPLMPRLFMALRMEDRFPILDILEQTPEIPERCQWAHFLRNHDELTLEMVTDEERDYMYRVYAHDAEARINLGIRRRLAPLLENSRRKIELMNSLLFSLPGTPVLYYGDEIGMGDNFYLGDRDGVRTPMQWSGDRNAGFSDANPQKLFLPVVIDPEYHYESVNVEAQQANPSSLLWWVRRLIALRKRYRAFGRGSLEWLTPGNKRILAFVRRHEEETILVVGNLSRFVQGVELDLAEYAGRIPVELFGRNDFPRIDEEPYFLTLGPHGFFWFSLETEASRRRPYGLSDHVVGDDEEIPALRASRGWPELLRGRDRSRLEGVLLPWLRRRRWFAGKGREVRSAGIVRVVPLPESGTSTRLVLFEVDYLDAEAERYALFLAGASGDEAERILRDEPGSAVARVGDADGGVLLHEALADPGFDRWLLETVARGERYGPDGGAVAGVAYRPAGELLAADEGDGEPGEALEPALGRTEQSNTSVVFGDRWILKIVRKIEAGTNLDREIGLALTGRGFENTAPVAGALELRARGGATATLGVLQGFVPNQGDAWELTLDAVERYFERARASSRTPDELPFPGGELVAEAEAAVGDDLPEVVHELVGTYAESAWLLGRRTAELHRALAGITDQAAFAPERFTRLYQRSLYQSMRNLLGQTFRELSGAKAGLGEGARSEAERVLGLRDRIVARFRRVLDRKLEGRRIRCHGDYHLGQVLYTGKDFVIIDFEGEPARPLSERRLKRSPLRDVAGMVRSLHYAARTGLLEEEDRGYIRSAEHPSLEPWSRFWAEWASVAFFQGYLANLDGEDLIPEATGSRQLLLDLYLLEKALYELGYEVNNRPEWVRIPVEGILELVEGPGDRGEEERGG